MHTTPQDTGTQAPAGTPFTTQEIALLRELYAGVPIRQLRRRYRLEPWDILRRHHLMPREEYHAVRRQLGLGPYVVRTPARDVPPAEHVS